MARKTDAEKQALLELEQDCLPRLRVGDVNTATAMVQVYRRLWGRPVKFSMDPPTQEWLHLAYADLSYNIGVRKEIGIQLAFGSLLQETLLQRGKRILSVTNDTFTCPDMDEFLKSPCGRTPASPDAPAKYKAETYVHTIQLEWVSGRNLAQIMEMSREPFFNGIRVLACGDETCAKCTSPKRMYSIDELDNLPHLPHHWGCRCSYQYWSKRWDEF